MPKYFKIVTNDGSICYCLVDDFIKGKLALNKFQNISSINTVQMTEDEYLATFDTY